MQCRRNTFLASLCIALGIWNGNALATERAFLESIGGDWQAVGVVKVNTAVPAVNVQCDFKTASHSQRFDLTGDCRALLVVKKLIAANLTVSNNRYFGTYIGARTGIARLSGKRSGDSIDLKIKWAGTVNGDTMATMHIRKENADNLELIITDLDPRSGNRQVTSRFKLARK